MADDGNFWTGVFVAAVLAGSVYYCTKEDEPAIDYEAPEQIYPEEEVAANTTSDVPPEPATPPALEPNFDEKDGANYYYVGALTEEERKSGKLTGYVYTFQYGGKDDSGAHIVLSAGQRYTCSVPCKIIKAANGSLIQYSESTVIGVVFQDALRGFLKAPPKPKALPINEDPWIDYNNAPVASESSGSSLNTPLNSPKAPLDGDADKVQ